MPSLTKFRRDAKNLWSDLLTDAMAGVRGVNVLGIVPGRPLFSELGAHLKSARKYLRIKEEMDALRNEWHSRMDGIAQSWLKLAGATAPLPWG